MGIFFLMRAFALLLCAGALSQIPLWAREVAVVAGSDFPAQSLTREDVRDIFLGEKSLLGSLRLRPVDVKDAGRIRSFFLKTFLGVSEDGYQAYWIKKIFQEGGTPPSSLATLEALVQLLQADRTAIGFLWAEDAAKASGLKILLKIPSKE